MSWDVMLFPSEASLNILFNGLPIYLHPFTSTAKKKNTETLTFTIEIVL